MALSLHSSAFTHGATIPQKYTCDGADISPPLTWSDAPAATKSFVLIVDDPDAPDPAAPQRTWVHWVLYNIPADSTSLASGIHSADLPLDSAEGLNDWDKPGYGGPCPPIGQHRYIHKLYALDQRLPELGSGAKKADVEGAMQGHILEQAELIGVYQHGDAP